MMALALSVMEDATGENYDIRASIPTTALLEIGGVDATCRLATYETQLNLAEPILLEDLIDNDHPTDADFGYVETATIRHAPGELWIHVKNEWTDDHVFEDVMEAVERQLRAGRGVIFQNDIDEDEPANFWEDITGGWEDAGYAVILDYDEETGREWVHVRTPEPDFGVHEILMVQGENGNADNQPGGVQHVRGQDGGQPEGQERGAKAIRFPISVPTAIASSLRRLHQNLGHPSTSDFVRHLRLAGATREVLKAAKSLTCQTCQRTKGPGAPKPAKQSRACASTS